MDDIPDRVVQALLSIENRHLLTTSAPTYNPAVEWSRLGRALIDFGHKLVQSGGRRSAGASTLATQLEKFRHSPEGRTTTPEEKLRQMVSASLRAYLNGQDTRAARRQIVVHYINGLPLGAAPGFGEVFGIGDGLWAWYGEDFDRVNQLLRLRDSDLDGLDERQMANVGLAFRQVLSLFIAQRRPRLYLVDDPDLLQEKTSAHVRALASRGVISERLRDAVLATRASLRSAPVSVSHGAFLDRKAVNSLRGHLEGLLGMRALYELDRLDLVVEATIDRGTQSGVMRTLRKLANADFVRAAGLRAHKLLRRGDPADVIYSFTLYERGPDGNRLRVQADTFDGPFDINAGSKLELGSTAKLRTLVSYLEVVADLHERYSPLERRELRALKPPIAIPRAYDDPLTHWAVRHLLYSKDRSLQGHAGGGARSALLGQPIGELLHGRRHPPIPELPRGRRLPSHVGATGAQPVGQPGLRACHA